MALATTGGVNAVAQRVVTIVVSGDIPDHLYLSTAIDVVTRYIATLFGKVRGAGRRDEDSITVSWSVKEEGERSE